MVPQRISSPAPGRRADCWRGSLFAQDFLSGPLTDSPAWKGLGDEALAAVEGELQEIVERFPRQHQPNEATTEDELIWPVLKCLGWREVLRQQRLSSRGREDVPDGLLFANDGAKTRALEQEEEWQRYGHGVALVESIRRVPNPRLFFEAWQPSGLTWSGNLEEACLFDSREEADSFGAYVPQCRNPANFSWTLDFGNMK